MMHDNGMTVELKCKGEAMSSYLNMRRVAQALVLFFVLIMPVYAAEAASAPVVVYTDIVAGPNVNGENNKGAYLSVFGRNFGSDISKVKVYVGSGEVARYIYLGASLGRPDIQQISVQLGPAVTSGAVRVVVNGVASNTDVTFTVRAGDFFFVSRTGSDSTGVPNDITRPYRTANYVMGLSSFAAGDFMVIRGGNYDLSAGNAENIVYSRWLNLGVGSGSGVKSGTSEANSITIYGYPGENAVVDWGTITSTGLYGIRAIGSTSYYAMANLTFNLRDSGGAAVYLGFYSDPNAYCNSCRIVNMKVTGGMAGASGGANSFYLHRADNFKLYGLNIGNQSPQAVPDLGSHMIYVSHFYTNGDLGWCYLHDNKYGRGALQLAGDPWGATPYSVATGTWGQNTNVRIHDSLFLNLPQEAILANLGSDEIFIYNNLIINANTKKNPGFSPIALRGGNANKGRYHLYNNTIYTDAESGGIIQMGYVPSQSWPQQVTLYNNIIYAMSPATKYYYFHGSSMTLDKVTSDNNIWYGSSSAIPAFAGLNDFAADPQFAYTPQNNYRLLPASPAIGKGTTLTSSVVSSDYDLNRRYLGAGYDIGAFQYQSGANYTIPRAPLNIKVTK